MRVARSRLVGLLSAIVCVALAATAVQVSDSRPEYDYVRGQVGRPLAVEDGEVLVDQVRVGTQLVRGGDVMDTTPGAFVVVGVTLAATGHREVLYSSSRLVTSGPRTYNQFSSQSVRAAPGFSERLDFVFEVDPAQVEDLTLELWRLEIISGYQARVQVHLGITAANAAQWRESAAGRRVQVETTPTTRALG